MVTFASGKRDCTASAITCAAVCLMSARPSSEPCFTGSSAASESTSYQKSDSFPFTLAPMAAFAIPVEFIISPTVVPFGKAFSDPSGRVIRTSSIISNNVW